MIKSQFMIFIRLPDYLIRPENMHSDYCVLLALVLESYLAFYLPW